MKNQFKFLPILTLAVLSLACAPELLRAAHQNDQKGCKSSTLKGLGTITRTVTLKTKLFREWSLFQNTVMKAKYAVVNYEDQINLYVLATCGHTWRLPPIAMKINPPIAPDAG